MSTLAAVISIGLTSLTVQPAPEFLTADNAVLCVARANVDVATRKSVAKSAFVLRAMGCVRIESGIRARLLEPPEAKRPWQVRVYPAGMSGGVVLWGLSSSFTALDGSQVSE